MAIQYTDYTPLLKEIYSKDISDVTLKDTPLFALLPKRKDLGGTDLKIPIRYATPQGISADFPTAQAIATVKGSSSKYFTVLGNGKSLYANASIPTQVARGSNGNAAAWVKLVTYEIDGVLQGGSQVLNALLYGDGWGSFGNVASFTGKTVTLSVIEDAIKFQAGMVLMFAPDPGTSSSRANGSGLTAVGAGPTIAAVDTVNGILTFTNNIADASLGVPTIANGDYIFMLLNRQTTPTAHQCVDGLAAWLPSTSPQSGESFHGVDRSSNTRLYGLFLDATSVPLNQALVTADMMVTTQGGKISHYFMHPRRWAELSLLLESKVQIVKSEATVKGTQISFPTIDVVGMNGQAIKLVQDRHCPVNTIFGLELDSWVLCSQNEPMGPINDDGNEVLRAGSTDTLEFRGGGYLELACMAPGHNIQIKVG